MATATATARKEVKEFTYLWEGMDRNNRQVRGEMRAASETVVTTNLRRQGVRITKIKRQTFRGGRKVTDRDITFFTRQMATMLRSGVPLLQSFEIVARGAPRRDGHIVEIVQRGDINEKGIALTSPHGSR